ncbi:hypothetical protein M8J77_003548 [Diaphorina citri]|nr:hypothetical protein M8J77_003548 [Diaphorina citri]
MNKKEELEIEKKEEEEEEGGGGGGGEEEEEDDEEGRRCWKNDTYLPPDLQFSTRISRLDSDSNHQPPDLESNVLITAPPKLVLYQITDTRLQT